ncbi:hypothetical protein G6F51_014746 [Rhizopus arrhizus]|uniref:Uncharacterized protein n=1 Tax=Rhizopus oryzae TaxID=64495 RepID=A0A9P6XLW3_RHIOR|nr:hypothetical protein G6F51_014746 [Rhizopus arrhizus]
MGCSGRAPVTRCAITSPTRGIVAADEAAGAVTGRTPPCSAASCAGLLADVLLRRLDEVDVELLVLDFDGFHAGGAHRRRPVR